MTGKDTNMDESEELESLVNIGESLSNQVIESLTVCHLALEADRFDLLTAHYQRVLELQERLSRLKEQMASDFHEALTENHTIH